MKEAGRRVVSPRKDVGKAPSGLLERTLAALDLLAREAQGLPLSDVAGRLRIPRSATHRLLTQLVAQGYVRQLGPEGDYVLTTRLASLAFTWLSGSGVADLAQPVLDRLARETGELVRLSLVDGDRLTWVAKAQGSPYGLRYDPDMGQVARLSCSASGHAWLSCLDEKEALRLAKAQGLGSRKEYGPNAPRSLVELTQALRLARAQGYAALVQAFSPWMNAMAAPVRRGGSGEATGTVTIAGPHLRFTEERMRAAAPHLLQAARDVALATSAAADPARRKDGLFKP